MAAVSPVSIEEADALFAGLERHKALVLAVSGGPDSMALMLLAAQWRARLGKKTPGIVVVTIDHGLRAASKKEAASVARAARQLGLAPRTLKWTGQKPTTGLLEAARFVRYRLLAQAASKAGARAVLTAHTQDDQAETVLIRMARGSGMTGLAAMAKSSVIPGREQSERNPNGQIQLIRPLLDLPKARLIATLDAAGITFFRDPSNHDPRFTRARLRGLMPMLADEGLDSRRLALLARRLGRADAALEHLVDAAHELMLIGTAPGSVQYDRAHFEATPDEIALRVLGRAISRLGDEGPVELAKLETLKAALDAQKTAKSGQGANRERFRRTLAGALITLTAGVLAVEQAPPRRAKVLTKP